MKIYIAGPYMHKDQAINVRDAIFAGEQVIKIGHIPYIPHLNHLWHLVCPHPLEFWYEYDLHWLRVCDAVWRLPGESHGANMETSLAVDLRIPIFYSFMELKEYIDNSKNVLSKCCRADAKVVYSDFPDFVGGDPKNQKISTGWYECSKCGGVCDILWG